MLLGKSIGVSTIQLEDYGNSTQMFLQSSRRDDMGIMDAVATKRVLFIDDDLHIRIVVQTCLETLGGWDVLLADSAQEGLVKAETEQPDAILLDVMMPEMDGLAFLQRLKANPVTESIPVVLLTARVSLTERQRFQELGVKGAIAKPFNSLTLVPQLAKTLGWLLS